MVPISMFSVVIGYYINIKTDLHTIYFFVEDSNKLIGFMTSVVVFLLFLNIDIKQSSFINRISKTTFGVLLIHANCDTMRRWLWGDVLNCVKWFNTRYYVIHMLTSVIMVYAICVLIDSLRIIIFKKICCIIEMTKSNGNSLI